MQGLITAGFFVVAFLYSSVGHGGASGYLALLSFTGAPKDQMATTALIVNLLVAGISFFNYARAGHFSWKLTWPFVIASVPTAFIGGLVKIPTNTYELLLSVSLLVAAWRLLRPSENIDSEEVSPNLSLKYSLPVGAVIGLVSGMIGIGGGIFLSPAILLARLAGPKKTSATAAFFILVNALAGLAGRAMRSSLVVGDLLPLMVAGMVGGLIGSYFGAKRWTGVTIRRVLSVVLALAASKLILQVF